MQPKETWLEKASGALKDLNGWLTCALAVLGFALLCLSLVSNSNGLHAVAFRSSTTGWLIILYVYITSMSDKLDKINEKLDEDYTLVPTVYVEAVIERATKDAATEAQMENVKSVERMVGKEKTENEIV